MKSWTDIELAELLQRADQMRKYLRERIAEYEARYPEIPPILEPKEKQDE